MTAEQLVAKAGAPVTGVAITTTYTSTLPVVQYIAAVIGVCVGLMTFTYYTLLVIEKIRAWRKK